MTEEEREVLLGTVAGLLATNNLLQAILQRLLAKGTLSKAEATDIFDFALTALEQASETPPDAFYALALRQARGHLEKQARTVLDARSPGSSTP